MQDTQKYQDSLLCQIFPTDDENTIIQRFGDPDQAIFHGAVGEKPNESFNNKSANDMDFIVHKSHRFDGSIADKVKSFSLNEVPLETEQSEEWVVEQLEHHSKEGDFQHTLLVFDDDSCESVVGCFAELISSQFSNEKKSSDRFCVKAVGAVGNEIDPTKEQLKIGHYWRSYDKGRSKANFKPDTLQEAVVFCRRSNTPDWADSYKLLLDCVVRLLSLTGFVDENERNHTPNSLRSFLKSINEWENFREIIYLLLSDATHIDQKFWTDICDFLKLVFKFGAMFPEAEEFLAYSDEVELIEDEDDVEEVVAPDPVQPAENSFLHPDGFRIELSTIHGVKGETHDATLVLETKNNCFDFEVMLPYLTGYLPSAERPNSNMPEKPHPTRAFKPNKVFMRQLYVAMSRPRHLLCFAIHSDRITHDQETALLDLGWNIENVPTPVGVEE